MVAQRPPISEQSFLSSVLTAWKYSAEHKPEWMADCRNEVQRRAHMVIGPKATVRPYEGLNGEVLDLILQLQAGTISEKRALMQLITE